MTNLRLISTASILFCILLGSVALAQKAPKSDDFGLAEAEQLLNQFEEDFKKASKSRRQGMLYRLRSALRPRSPSIFKPEFVDEVVDAHNGEMDVWAAGSLIPNPLSCPDADTWTPDPELYAKAYPGKLSAAPPIDDPATEPGFLPLPSGNGLIPVETARIYSDLPAQTLVVWEVIRYYDDQGNEIEGCRRKQSAILWFYGHEPNIP